MCPASIRFDASQEKALKRITATLSSGRPLEFTLGGLAGSGKSTILKEALQRTDDLGLDVAAGSFTGRAADVLRRKGVGRAQTLHSLMYEFDPGTRTFHRRTSLECQGVIVDEASMVNRDLCDDLRSFGIPIVWVGDHGQLEPIGDNPNLMAKPDMVLERIYRQAEGSAILDVAHAFRQGLVPDWKTGPEVARLSFNQAMEQILAFDVVLCATNITRMNVNRFIRRKKGRVLTVECGEMMVCLRNNRNLGIFNGMILEVDGIHRANGETYILDLKEVGTGRIIPRASCKMAQGGEENNFLGANRDIVYLDYGYCLSVHKAQGSEAGRVLVIEERGPWDRRRWNYTAATRASRFLAWTR